MSTTNQNSDSQMGEGSRTDPNHSNSASLPQDLILPPPSMNSVSIFTNHLDNLIPFPKCHQQTQQQQHQLEKQRQILLQIADFLFPPSLIEASIAVLDDPSSPIQYLRATPSNRTIILVREYFCFTEKKDRGGCKGLYYCSCRSFYERLKRNKGEICKHILAVLMAPFLGLGGDEYQQIEDEKYVQLVLEKSNSNYPK